MTKVTKFIYTKIPNTAQYKKANWAGYKYTKPGNTFAQAQAIAKENADISYFFQVNNSVTLEGIDSKNVDGNFSSNDSVFFMESDKFWLGGATNYADTYMVAEVYDTSNSTTCNEILAELRKDFLIGGLDTSSGTPAAPKIVTVGFVFVDFNDVKDDNDDTETLKQKLMGPVTDGKSALENFVIKESNGRVNLSITTFTPEGGAKWVTLSKNRKEYEDKFSDLTAEVDSKIEYPAGWDIAVFVFPDKAKKVEGSDNTAANEYETDNDDVIQYSHCLTGQVVDLEKAEKTLQYVLVDPATYTDQHGVHTITIHEIMHALNLPDLYDIDAYRSYGWSIMSARQAGSHITQFEKLLLGWEDPDKFVFLKRGMIPANNLLKGDNTKGVVILPDLAAGRKDTYFIEKAQEIGIGDTNIAAFRTNNTDTSTNEVDYGLLLMMVRADRQEGTIIPYVCNRQTINTAIAACTTGRNPDEDKYGGASKAPFKKTSSFSTNGIFSFPAYSYLTDDGKAIDRIIGVDGGYRPSDQAKKLRENEKIVNGSFEFMMTTSGLLQLGGSKCKDCLGNPVSIDLYHTDYGYVVFVDKIGVLKFALAVDEKAEASAVIKSFPMPTSIASLDEGEYFFKVESDDADASKPCVAIYKKISETSSEKKYTALRQQ